MLDVVLEVNTRLKNLPRLSPEHRIAARLDRQRSNAYA